MHDVVIAGQRYTNIVFTSVQYRVNDIGGCNMIEKIEKPWGSELKFAHTAHYVGKILEVKGGEALSVQYHKQKVETMHVLSGTGRMVLYIMDEDGETTATSVRAMESGDTFHIPPNQIHRIIADTDMKIIEVSTNHLNDLVRLQDRYNRK
jgi:mannose-6-phosphate isomerase